MQLWTLIFSAALVAWPTAMAQESSLASALSRFPPCAMSCLADAVGNSGCLLTDQTCMCKDESLQQAVTVCVRGSCKIKEALLTKNITATSCGEPVRDKSREYVAISNAFGILSAIFVIQRFSTKFWLKLDFGLDDWLTLVAIVTGVPATVFNAYTLAPNGMGRDTWTLTFDNITNFVRYFFIMEILYFADVALVKLALLFFYVRIFPSTKVRQLLWGTIIFVALFGVTFVFVAIFQCTPVSYYWLKWDEEHQGKCLNVNAIAWSNAAISIALDIWMLGIPLWQLKNLNMGWKKKVGVGMMLCVGTFVTVVSILRLRGLVKFGADSVNPTWDFFDVGMWSTVEINVGLICVCMPSLRLLLVHLFPNLLGTTQRYYARYASGAKQSTANKRTSRPLATGTTSHVDVSEHRPVSTSNRITYHKTYAVEYGDKDIDEMQLVHMPHAEMTSGWTGSSRSGES